MTKLKSLIVVNLIWGCWGSLVWGQVLIEEKNARIKAGKQFLSSSMLKEWERAIRKAPNVCGKVSLYSSRFNGALASERWYREAYSLRRSYRDGKQLNSVIVLNPKYSANIELEKSSPNLIWFQPTSEIPVDTVMDSNFNLSSMIHNNYRAYIFEFLKTGELQIEDYSYENGYHFVDLVMETKFEGIESIQLRFDERYLPLPDTRVSKREGRQDEVFMYREFIEVGGFWLPTKVYGYNLAEGETMSWDAPKEGMSRITIEPEVTLDTTQCYLEYYGLPEPDMGPVADFGRKSNRLVWIASAMGAVSLLVLIYMFWVRTRQRQ